MPIGGMELGFMARHLNASLAIGINAGLCLIVTLSLLAWSLTDRSVRIAN